MKRFESLLGVVAGLALFLMMWLTFADVVGRKFVGESIVGSVELTELLMMLVIFVAMPLASLAGEHIVFDLLDRFLPAAARRWQHRVSHLVTALLMLGAAWVVAGRAARSLEYGDITAQLSIALGPFHYMIAAMLVVTAAMHCLLALRAGETVH